MFEKIRVTGRDIDPLFAWLTSEQRGFLSKAVKWNFTKFLIGKNGEVLDRFAPQTQPKDIAEKIEQALASM